MRTKKVINYRRTAVSLLVLLFVIPAISSAGQFDALYLGASKASRSNLETWHNFFPGLEEQIQEAFQKGKNTGDFLFHSNKLPVAWNVDESRNIEVNSINVGYFRSLRDPNTYQWLFPGLTVESQNITVSAGHDLIVSPIPVAEKGFGYALSVGPNQDAILTANNLIILMEPRIGMVSSYFDEMSIGMSENAKASLSAKQIILFGGVEALYGSSVKLTAGEGVYLLDGNERALGAATIIRLTAGRMEVDAPNIFIDHEIQIGQTLFNENFPGSLYIGQDSQAGIKTNNVFFNQKVSAERNSELRIDAADATIFQQPLNLIWNAQANIRSNRIGLFKLFLGDSGAHARFQITNDGYMYTHDPISVGKGSQLTVDLEPRAVLSSIIDTHIDGDTYIHMSPDSFWYSNDDSNITLLSVAPASYVQLGPKNKAVQIKTEKLSGEGGIFYLAPNSTGSLKITENSEGNHGVLLASSGASLQDTRYLYHIAVDDASPDGSDKARFELANDGIIDAGPYEYKLGIYPFKKQNGDQGESRVWVILGDRSLKPTPPDEVITPPNPDTSKPDLPDLPFDPGNPPPFDSSEEQPIGLSPAAKITLASIASGNQVIQFLGTLDDLRTRMGEIRNGADDSLYVLYRHDKSRYHSNYSSNSQLKYSAFTFGGDYRVNKNWIIGTNLILTRGKIHVKDVPGNHSRVDSVGAKFYAAWLGDKDQYVDTVLTINRYSNKLHARSVDESITSADYRNYGVGLSVEAGKRFYLPIGSGSSSWFVDPQVQLSYFRVSSASFRFSNDMKVHVDSANSLNGRIGLDLGRNFTDLEGNNIGQLYLRTGVNHDFLGKTKVRMNEFSFKDHSIGTRIYYGVGGEGVISNKFKVFGQINRESGSRLKTDFQVKFGLKYLF
ncbi:autotransporter outer membrane beta-barrel domain-containing protein [uncultured Parasutterella sp.]|uniref:autotransporter outer membrane beta-barrel domain-containing protein n=1 Tax=uncultured Parasutterella sp. TaxID=1263098 RepID=UPI0025EE3DFD|nr:autotransporter outer membrane beta-barrel domain-containing protein [uncultured Parasutterella sp.]